MISHDRAPTEIRTMYYLDGIPYVPHYRDRGLFVPPGRDAAPVDEWRLRESNATPVQAWLMKRP